MWNSGNSLGRSFCPVNLCRPKMCELVYPHRNFVQCGDPASLQDRPHTASRERYLKICVVSPHRDDACFSLGLSLVRWAHAGHRIRVLNCFTRSAFAPYSDADTVHQNDRTSYVSAMREKEDKVFVRRVPGAGLIDLRLKDAPLRFRCGVDEVFRRALDEADPAIAKIASALEKRVGSEDAELLLLPLGLGAHVDHITARHAAMPFALPLACGFYEDLPYASREGADQEIEADAAETWKSGTAGTPIVISS